MWIDYFPHHCDQMLDRKAMYGRKGLFCLWFEGAESIMVGRGQSQGCRRGSLGLLASRQTRNGERRMRMQLAFSVCFLFSSWVPAHRMEPPFFRWPSTSVNPWECL